MNKTGLFLSIAVALTAIFTVYAYLHGRDGKHP